MHLTEVTAKVQKAVQDVELLKAEVLKCLKGESAFSKEMLAAMIAEGEKECAALEQSRQAAQVEVEQSVERMEAIGEQYDKLISWAELFDSASSAAKKMIVNQLIKRVDVGRDYQVTITFHFSYQQFLDGLDTPLSA